MKLKEQFDSEEITGRDVRDLWEVLGCTLPVLGELLDAPIQRFERSDGRQQRKCSTVESWVEGKSAPGAKYAYRLRKLVDEVLATRDVLRDTLKEMYGDIEVHHVTWLRFKWQKAPVAVRAIPDPNGVVMTVKGGDLMIRNPSASLPLVELVRLSKEEFGTDLQRTLRPVVEAVGKSVKGQQPRSR